MKRFLCVLLMAVCAVASMRAGDAKAPNKDTDLALDEAQAGPDFKVQGEYVGEIAGDVKKLGADIMALGGGTFRAVYYKGGLPGDGWDGDVKLRVMDEKEWQVDGKTEGDKTVFTKPYAATLQGETLSGADDKGNKFELKKIVRKSPTLGSKPPEGGEVLFDGSNLDNWTGKGEIDARKFLCTQHGNALTKKKYKDFVLHVEYMEPFKPYGREQDRGNSGVYLQNRYEVQVLDSFGRTGKNNEAGGIYTKAAPKLNMVFPPLSVQTYDIDFTAAKWEDGKKVKNPVATIKHNGVLIHDNQEISSITGGGQKETAEPGEIQLQGHGNPVFFKYIWIAEKK